MSCFDNYSKVESKCKRGTQVEVCLCNYRAAMVLQLSDVDVLPDDNLV